MLCCEDVSRENPQLLSQGKVKIVVLKITVLIGDSLLPILGIVTRRLSGRCIYFIFAQRLWHIVPRLYGHNIQRTLPRGRSLAACNRLRAAVPAFVLAGTGLLPVGATLAEPVISGQWIQGGLLKGKTAPGNKVRIFGREVYVDQHGGFVFGLGRDAAESVALTIENGDGSQQQFTYQVKQREYRTQKIEGVEQKYVAPPPEVTKRIKNEAARVWQARRQTSNHAHFGAGFSWPLIGPITGVYGSQRIFNGVPKRPHYGLDIAGPVGAVVSAPAPGVVTLAHDDMYYSGGTLIIDHGQGVSSTFIHLSKLLVGVGESVQRGRAVAEVGATGRVTGPHLDWRINWFDQRLDPYLLLPPMPDSGEPAAKASAR